MVRKKLTLKTQTIRHLTGDDLNAARGGQAASGHLWCDSVLKINCPGVTVTCQANSNCGCGQD